jgi:hypothetical protein
MQRRRLCCIGLRVIGIFLHVMRLLNLYKHIFHGCREPLRNNVGKDKLRTTDKLLASMPLIPASMDVNYHYESSVVTCLSKFFVIALSYQCPGNSRVYKLVDLCCSCDDAKRMVNYSYKCSSSLLQLVFNTETSSSVSCSRVVYSCVSARGNNHGLLEVFSTIVRISTIFSPINPSFLRTVTASLVGCSDRIAFLLPCIAGSTKKLRWRALDRLSSSSLGMMRKCL